LKQPHILASAIVAASLLAGAAPHSAAQEKYPSRPIEFIVPWGPGGGADQLARKVAPALEKELKVSLPVLNVAGATGQTGLTKILTSGADGYTISIMTGDTFGLLTDPTTKWKLEEIVPAAIMIRQPSAFFTSETGALKTWADVEREAKTRPLKVAITGFGSPDDMTVQYFVRKGLKFVSVPFAKPAERYTAILGGHADILYEQLGDVKSFLEGKQMRPVIVFAHERFPLYKEVPAGKELGHDIVINQFRAVVLKAGTDPGRVKLISDGLAKYAVTDDYKAYLKDQYADEKSFVAGSGALAFMKQELETMKKYAPKK